MKRPRSIIRTYHRRGTALVMVLAIGLVLSVMLAGALLVTSAQRAGLRAELDATDARAACDSGLDLALEHLRSHPDGVPWRSTSLVTPTTSLGLGRVLVRASDPVDADLSDAMEDPVELTSEAVVGSARQMISMRVTPVLQPLPAMSRTIVAGGSIIIQGADVFADAPLAANSSIISQNANVNAVVQSPSVSGGSYRRTLEHLSDALVLPEASMMDRYVGEATTIVLGSIPGGVMSGVLLSPTHNPYGAVRNSRGLYVIHCAHQRITIQNSRVFGTLILLDPAPGSSIRSTTSLSPADETLPALLVRGSIQISLSSMDLRESAIGVNLNPPGSAHMGVTNANLTDAYASSIVGGVFISGSAQLDGLALEGTIIVRGDVEIRGEATLRRGIQRVQSGLSFVSGWKPEYSTYRRRVE